MQLNNKKILIVAGFEQVGQTIKPVLKRLAGGGKIEIIVCNDITSAIEIIGVERFDLIITDPFDGQGVGLAHLAKEKYRETFTILMSGGGSNQEGITRFDGFLEKPFEIQTLKSMIDSLT
ncbi:MAG: response regulator [Candidatus Taylorbacteria bacterium]|nr:response regulator [Candidatus Taylorbacteria bacterium]